uniref:Bm14435 n=1 Tax=Brugia malayi TaxID=6279 RepID=A0A1I9G5N2_BRUMA|nr:Bm14435 [Brugia malayi]
MSITEISLYNKHHQLSITFLNQFPISVPVDHSQD